MRRSPPASIRRRTHERTVSSGGPWEVQCDGCLVVRSGNARQGGLQIIFADIKFNPRAKDDRRRLCPPCRDLHWKDYRS